MIVYKINYWLTSFGALIAMFMVPTWVPHWTDRTQVGWCWPHGPCYLVWVWSIIHKERCCCNIYVLGLHSIWSARRKSDTSGRDKPAVGAWWRHQMETFAALLAIFVGNSPVTGEGQWRGALMFSLICTRINDWVNTHEAGDLRRLWRHRKGAGS